VAAATAGTAAAQEPPPAGAGAPAGTPAAAPDATPAPADAAAAAAPPAAPAPAADWQSRLDEVDQRARVVDRKLELAAEAEAQRRKESPSFTADEGGFAAISADRRYQIKLKGLLQQDSRVFFGDTTIQNGDTFLLRRVRPILDGTLLGLVDFRFSPDFGNNTTVVIDAYLDVHPLAWLRLRAGKFKPPVGLERLQADQDVAFIERGLDSNFSAQREIGLQLYGDIAGGVVRYEAAITNGVPDGTVLDTDTDRGKTYYGRLLLQPFAAPGLRGLGRLAAGVAFSSGNEKGSGALGGNTWLGTVKSVGQSTIFSYVTSTTDATTIIYAQGRHSRVNPQLYYYNGPVGLLAEWIHENQALARGANNGTGVVNNSAGHVTLSYVLGGDVTYEGVKPRHALDLATGALGALEIAVRYHWLDMDDVAFNPATIADPTKSVTSAKGAGLALNWQLSTNFKAGADYDQTSFKGGAAKSADRATEKVVITRLQVSF
jgi:phosphate-selective porin OprO/OprP